MGEGAWSPRETSSKTANDTLVEHADRLWNSECENAGRIANKMQLIAGAALVLIGISIFGAEWFYYIPSAPICPTWATILIHSLLFVAVVLLFFTLAILYARKDLKPTANSVMELTNNDVDRHTKTVVFSKIYLAYLDLKERNAAERIRLSRAEAFFSVAVFATILGILLFILTSLGAKIKPVQDAGQSNPTASTQK